MKKTFSSIILISCFALSAFFLVPANAEGINVSLQIPIGDKQNITVCSPVGEILSCTGIAEYIATIYRWLIGFSATLAVLALVWGGVQWLTSGGESGKIQEARKVIGNAIIGLLLALGSYGLLYTINPKLVQYNALQIRGIAKLELVIDPPEEMERTGTNPSGACCPSAEAAEVLRFIENNGVNDLGGFRSKYTQMNPKLFAAIKMVLGRCTDAGLAITSTIRPGSAGSWHQKGGAIDFSGKICGVDPKELCDNEKSKNLIAELLKSGYEVGTYQGVCSSFKDRGTGPHMHIELPGSPN